MLVANCCFFFFFLGLVIQSLKDWSYQIEICFRESSS